MQVDGRIPIGLRQRDVVIHSLTANIGQFKLCNSLVNFFLWPANVFTLDSNEHYFRSRNRALPQDSHSLRGSPRDLWTLFYNDPLSYAVISTGSSHLRTCMCESALDDIFYATTTQRLP
jgi:hypothetical protein